MPILRKLTVFAGAAEAARRYVRRNPDKINRMAGNAGNFVNRQTKGRYHKQINTAIRKVSQDTSRQRNA